MGKRMKKGHVFRVTRPIGTTDKDFQVRDTITIGGVEERIHSIHSVSIKRFGTIEIIGFLSAREEE